MSITDRLANRFAKPSSSTLDAPVRDLVQAILKEHGYASPAEVQALRDEVRDARARVDTLDKRLGELSRQAAPVEDPRVASLEAKLKSLEAALHELSAQPVATIVAPATPLTSSPPGTCKVEGCGSAVRSKGFCSPHYQHWRRGSLPGFVGPEGSVVTADRVFHVAESLAGQPAEVQGKKVLVDGREVPTKLGR